MNDEPDRRTRKAEPEPLAPTGFERACRRLPVALLNVAGVLNTTMMIVAIEPKAPPYKGD
jgi:hypothetical protein